MIEVILLGILTSYIAELVTAINKKLVGTVLQGDGAFLIALAMAVIGAVVKEAITPGFNLSHLTNWPQLTADITQVWAVSQLYFMFVVKKFNLDVQTTQPVVPTPQPGATA